MFLNPPFRSYHTNSNPASVFFSTNEQDHGTRDSKGAQRQLEWFQTEVSKRGLREGFKLPGSLLALQRFYRINQQLFDFMKYQELNQQAINKILKSE